MRPSVILLLLHFKDFLCYSSSGTKQYLAPEVFTRSHAHGPAADYWSLGESFLESEVQISTTDSPQIILYNLVTRA